MDNQTQQNDLKQQFIIELMVFSPKYNLDLAEEIVSTLTPEQLSDMMQKLTAINADEADELAELETNNPQEYQKRLKDREEAEEAADEQFAKPLEEKMMRETEEVDKKAGQLEQDVDQIADQAEKEINEEYDESDKLLESFFEDVKKAQEENPAPASPEAPRELGKIQDEIQQIQNAAPVAAASAGETPVNPTDHAAEEKKSDNWQ